MQDVITLEGEITEDGQLKLLTPLPPGWRGRVEVRMRAKPAEVQEAPADDSSLEELPDDMFDFLGLPAEEIARAPEIGSIPDLPDGKSYVEQMRREMRGRRQW